MDMCLLCVGGCRTVHNACLQVCTYCWKLCSAPDECVLFHTKLISLFQSPLSHLHSAPPSSSLLLGFTHYRSSLTLFQMFSPLLLSLAYFFFLAFFLLPFLLTVSAAPSIFPFPPSVTHPPPTPCFLSLSLLFLPVVWLPWCQNAGISLSVGVGEKF